MLQGIKVTENLVFSGNYCNLKGLYSISDLTEKRQ